MRNFHHFAVIQTVNTRQVYLPAGQWIDFWSNERHPGGQIIAWSNANQMQFPLFAREGAIVPMLLTRAQTLCDANYVNNPEVTASDDGLLFLVYPGAAASFTVHDGTEIGCRSGPGNTVVKLSSIPRRVQFQVLGDAPGAIARDGVELTKFATAAEFEVADAGWRAESQTRLIFIKFQHGGGATTIQF